MAIADLLGSKFAVNPFAIQIVVERKPEAVEDVKSEISEKVNLVFEEYKKAYSYYHKAPGGDMLEYFSHLKLDVLLPQEVDLVLQAILNSHLEDESYQLVGFMISQLINDSYKAGNNDFNITTNDCSVGSLFNKVCGTEKNPVIATVFGNAGSYFGYRSEHCIFDVNGTAVYFGLESKHCNYTIHGNAGILCGYKSNDCTYDIRGTIDECLSNDVRNSVFKVRNHETYQRLNEKLPSSNTIQLLDGVDRIIMETRK